MQNSKSAWCFAFGLASVPQRHKPLGFMDAWWIVQPANAAEDSFDVERALRTAKALRYGF
jgi:hypothetical protein